MNKKEQRIATTITAVMRALSDGQSKTRKDIEAWLGTLKIYPRDWLAVEEGVGAKGVQISNEQRGERHYQLSTSPSPFPATEY